jgi:voltage-gated potassium channel
MPQSYAFDEAAPRSRLPAARLRVALAALASLTTLGTAGYVLIEGMALPDALYMTVITLSTVGYGETVPLSEIGRLYTIGLIVLGVGTVFYAVGTLTSFLIEGRLQQILGRRTMKRAIAALHDHVIVCGFGRFGRAVSEHLRLGGKPVVVIDSDPAIRAECDGMGCLFVLGSALEDEVLAEAGIERARALVAATPSDSDNVFISLSAREANPPILIHARAETRAGVRRLRLSGANQVISPHRLGGQRVANAIIRPGVVEFLELSTPGDGADVDLEEIALSADSALVNTPLGDLSTHGLRAAVVAIKREDEPLRLNPGPTEVLRAGDRVVVVGDHEDLNRFAELAMPSE